MPDFFVIKGVEVECVDTYKYLGVWRYTGIWRCGDIQVSGVVDTYKYLGVVFENGLSWKV